MRLMIDIPDEDYKFIKNLQSLIIGGRGNCKTIQKNVINAIKHGTPLPKGHGRLIDASKFANDLNRAWTLWEKKGEDCYLFSDVLTPMLVSQKSVIEADKEKENG